MEEIEVALGDLAGDLLAQQVEQLLTPLFIVFEFMRFDPSIYTQIVAQFKSSRAAS